MSYPASKYIPGVQIIDSKSPCPGPIIVNVLPLPVCPYAKQVTLDPSKAAVTKG